MDNIGNTTAYPLLTISGTADSLSITDDNGVTFTYTGLSGEIKYNCFPGRRNVYSESPVTNQITNSNAEFISLNVGDNTIDVTGTSMVGVSIQFENASAFI